MKEYRRLKSKDGSDSVTRYYELKAGEEAYTNAFYEVVSGKATKISGAASGDGPVGFSFGGNALVDGCILLDINEQALYMCLLDDDDTAPAIGDLVNGYQRVIDTHYDDDSASGKGTNPSEWGVEHLDNPYYVFNIEQPAVESTGSITDSGAGTKTPAQKPNPSV